MLVAQVASHAQKYFIRLNSMNKKDKRRSSIHDITNPGGILGPSLSWQCMCLPVPDHPPSYSPS